MFYTLTKKRKEKMFYTLFICRFNIWGVSLLIAQRQLLLTILVFKKRRPVIQSSAEKWVMTDKKLNNKNFLLIFLKYCDSKNSIQH